VSIRSEHQAALRRQYADWARTHVAPQAESLDSSNQFNHLAWQDLTQKGFWEPLIDSDQPDVWWDFVACAQGMASTALDSGFMLTLVAQAAWIRAVHRFASEHQKQVLIPLLRGGALTAVGIAEPHGGTDAFSAETSMEDQGEHWIATGEKTNIAHGPTARLLLVTGKAQGSGKLTALVLEAPQPGISALPPDEKMGMRTLPTSSLVLKVAEGMCLGGKDQGRNVLHHIGLFARATYGLLLSQLPLPVLDETLGWLSDRHSLGIPLSSHQHVQRHLSDIDVALQTMESVSMDAMRHVMNQTPEATRMASVAKIYSCQAFLDAMTSLCALQGSMGYQRGAAERLLRDAHGWRNVGGTEEMHRLILAQNRLSHPR